MLCRCWIIHCKTEGCAVLTLDVIGPDKNYTNTLLPPLAPFNVTCCECNTSHKYTAADVKEVNLDNPSLMKPCRAFLGAVANGAWPDSDTAGFSNADGNSIAGVFWHSAGYILDRNGQRVGVEPDEPGWYYWYEGPDQLKCLHGPFTTMAQANFYLEANAL